MFKWMSPGFWLFRLTVLIGVLLLLIALLIAFVAPRPLNESLAILGFQSAMLCGVIPGWGYFHCCFVEYVNHLVEESNRRIEERRRNRGF